MLIFAHRGVSSKFPENSRTAIVETKNTPATGIELDIFQVGNEFVVFHDRWLTRLLGVQKRITDLSESELSRLTGKDGQALPTLCWVIETLSDCALELNIELKQVNDVSLFFETLSKLCKQFEFDLGRLIISSFNHTYLAYFAAQQSKIRLGALIANHSLDLTNALPDIPLYSVHLDMDCISAELIKTAQQNNRKVFVFTVDEEIEIDWLLNNKVDAIFANNPVQAYKIVNNLTE